MSARISGPALLLLLLLTGLAWAGASADWLSFPLAAPVRGLARGGSEIGLLQYRPALPFALLLTAAVAAFALRWQRLGSVLLGLAFAAWLAVPLAAWLLDPAWLLRYADDAFQRNALQYFLHSFVAVPNTGLDRFLTSADAFGYLPDRGRTVVAMLAWGWYFCGLVALALALLLRASGLRPSLRSVTLPLVSLVLLLAAGTPTLLADIHYRRGDQCLALGDYDGALQAYAAALARDPVLGSSSTFMLNVAKAAYQKAGTADPSAQVYRTLAAAGTSGSLQAGKLQLAVARVAVSDRSPLGLALAEMARRTEAQLWLKQGLMQYQRGALELAALGFRQALAQYPNWQHARFFLARILTEQKAFDAGAELLNQVTARIHDPSTLANVYSALGDLQAAAGRPLEARRAYAAAYALDAEGNLWAVKGLSGT